MKYFRISFLFSLLVICSFHLFSQTDVNNGNNKTAKDNFTLGDYKGALEEYLLLAQNDSTNLIYNFRIGICYLNTNFDKSKAISYLLKAVSDPKVEIMAWYELGRAYMINYQFDEAISKFSKYKDLASGKENFYISSDRMIEMCETAKKMILKPVNVTIENIGPEINSTFPDFNPYIPSDETFLVYSTKRAGNTGNLLDFDGFNTSDIFISYQKYDKWTKGKSIGNLINSELVEETAGISADGTKLFLYCDNYTAMNELMVANKKGKAFTKPDFLGENINTNKLESSATMTPDKKFLVFASDRNEVSGGMDLFISKKLPSGDWGPAENIGLPVNTVYDEDFPYFASDGTTLYFCSEGHENMGGYDIFKTTWNQNDNTWSEPENIGYPINTPDDDKTISLSHSGRHGYISSYRAEGLGDLDIYKIIFNDIDPAYSIISGTILNKDSLALYASIKAADLFPNDSIAENDTNEESAIDTIVVKVDPLKIGISVIDKITQKVFGTYTPNKENSKFLIVLPPGTFELVVDAKGYEKYTEDITVFDRSVNTEIVKDIVLTELSTEENN